MKYAGFLVEKLKFLYAYEEAVDGAYAPTTQPQSSSSPQKSPLQFELIKSMVELWRLSIGLHTPLLDQPKTIWNVRIGVALAVAREEFAIVSLLAHIIRALKSLPLPEMERIAPAGFVAALVEEFARDYERTARFVGTLRLVPELSERNSMVPTLPHGLASYLRNYKPDTAMTAESVREMLANGKSDIMGLRVMPTNRSPLDWMSAESEEAKSSNYRTAQPQGLAVDSSWATAIRPQPGPARDSEMRTAANRAVYISGGGGYGGGGSSSFVMISPAVRVPLRGPVEVPQEDTKNAEEGVPAVQENDFSYFDLLQDSKAAAVPVPVKPIRPPPSQSPLPLPLPPKRKPVPQRASLSPLPRQTDPDPVEKYFIPDSMDTVKRAPPVIRPKPVPKPTVTIRPAPILAPAPAPAPQPQSPPPEALQAPPEPAAESHVTPPQSIQSVDLLGLDFSAPNPRPSRPLPPRPVPAPSKEEVKVKPVSAAPVRGLAPSAPRPAAEPSREIIDESNFVTHILTNGSRGSVSPYFVDLREVQFGDGIGEGASAMVYKGTYRKHVVAVKCLRYPQNMMDETLHKEMEREVMVQAALKHPNLVQFVGLGIDPGKRVCILNELCAGGVLFRLLHARPEVQLSWRQKAKMALDVARGMGYLHAHKPPIIHRDLKTLNLLLTAPVNSPTDQIQVKITDFGMARYQDPNQYMTGKAGTFVFSPASYSVALDGP